MKLKAKMVKFVQFLHSGVEYKVNKVQATEGIVGWSQWEHSRKFLKALGKYMHVNNSISSLSELLFWGEWECPSRITKIVPAPNNTNMPHWIHKPFLLAKFPCPKSLLMRITAKVPNKKPDFCPNTDPLVLTGGPFLYSCCKQVRYYKKTRKNYKTQLQYLETGSIILFGSRLTDANGAYYFAVDTVFVVKDYMDYVPAQYKTNGIIPFTFPDYPTIMNFQYWQNSQIEHTCYRGATPGCPVQGMYSFVPCKQWNGQNVGFERLKVRNNDLANIAGITVLIADGQPQGYKISSANNKAVWDKLVDLTQKQKFELGVLFRYY